MPNKKPAQWLAQVSVATWPDYNRLAVQKGHLLRVALDPAFTILHALTAGEYPAGIFSSKSTNYRAKAPSPMNDARTRSLRGRRLRAKTVENRGAFGDTGKPIAVAIGADRIAERYRFLGGLGRSPSAAQTPNQRHIKNNINKRKKLIGAIVRRNVESLAGKLKPVLPGRDTKELMSVNGYRLSIAKTAPSWSRAACRSA